MRSVAARLAEARAELGPDGGVDGGDVGLGRRAAGADGPDRLVGHHAARRGEPVGQAAVELARHHRLRLAGQALRLALADADDRHEAGGDRGLRLGEHRGVAFPRGRRGARNGRG